MLRLGVLVLALALPASSGRLGDGGGVSSSGSDSGSSSSSSSSSSNGSGVSSDLLPRAGASCTPQAHGAKADGVAIDTAAINAAVQACGTVIFGRGAYLTGTIRLRNNTRLELAAGATVLAAPTGHFEPAETPPTGAGLRSRHAVRSRVPGLRPRPLGRRADHRLQHPQHLHRRRRHL